MKYGEDGRWEGRLPLHAGSITWRCGVRSCLKTLATYSTTRLALLLRVRQTMWLGRCRPRKNEEECLVAGAWLTTRAPHGRDSDKPR